MQNLQSFIGLALSFGIPFGAGFAVGIFCKFRYKTREAHVAEDAKSSEFSSVSLLSFGIHFCPGFAVGIFLQIALRRSAKALCS